MSVYFIDTSSLAKRYIQETGSSWIRSWIAPQHGHTIIISEICLVELVSVLAIKVRSTDKSQVITLSQLHHHRYLFLTHAKKEYLRIPIETGYLSQNLIVKHHLRGLDAIQLAAAIQAQSKITQAITFISSDKNLKKAAMSEGFLVDDPNLHP